MTDLKLRYLAQKCSRLSDEDLLEECEIETYTAGGPGGQHRNKTESGVRMMHRPTQTLVMATERRSQIQNRKVALERLRELLVKLGTIPKRRLATKATFGSKMRRLDAKKTQGDKKGQRRKVDW